MDSHAKTAHTPSFSRIWSEPVPKDSSPQIESSFASMRFPKYFHPVGTSWSLIFFSFATKSTAPLVGMERAQPFKPSLKYGMHSWALSTMIASESDGVTKNFFPKIMFLSASPSAAAPNSGTVSLFFSPRPIVSTRSWAYVRFGSGCPPPKSSLGSELRHTFESIPSSSPKIFLAKGPATPCMESYTMLKSSRETNFLILSKSKIRFIMSAYPCTASTTSISIVPNL
mmetsp:Transcript_32448/g.45225  ORF Transcript_32448/g.45225 Transcript_32448/m.45225 type:complete len:227 (-) Transcript_32448:268-948(-)